ncbi:MAG: hypothetical protein U0271_39050 [Polyangiaceae bacterium]
MTFLKPNAEQARAGLRAMKTTLTAAGAPLDGPRREALTAIQKHLLETSYDLDALEPIEPAELANAVDGATLREQLVGGLVTVAMVGEKVDPREAVEVERFAAALEVAPATVGQLRKFAEERFLLFRLDVIRNGPGGENIRQLLEEQGLLSVLKNALSFAGLIENTEVAERYHALEGYADGTLGKELWKFYKARNFKFPGERGGAPEALLSHDLSHVLGGYDTDIRSEGLVLSFTAGYRRHNPFAVLVFMLAQAQHGLKLTPLADTYKGLVSEPGLPDSLVRAFVRGSAMNIDLMDHWDFWAVMDRPIHALRKQYNILPA